MHSLFLTRSASKELDQLENKLQNQIIKKLQTLKENPRLTGSKKLQGREEYKLRVRDLRIIYGIDDDSKEITVYMIDNRKQVYRRLRRK